MSRPFLVLTLVLLSGHAGAAPPKNAVTVTVRADGTVSVQADSPVGELAARLRVLLPDPATTPVRLRINGGVDLAHLRAVERALDEAGIKSVLTVTGVTLRPPSIAQSTPSAAPPVVAGPVPASITVRVDGAGRTAIDGSVVSLDGLAADLLARAHGDRAVRVLLRGEPTTAYGGMVAAMEAVIAVGFQNVAIFDDPTPSAPTGSSNTVAPPTARPPAGP